MDRRRPRRIRTFPVMRMMKQGCMIAAVAALCAATCRGAIDLNGSWEFRFEEGKTLERNIVTGHCRIISPERKRAAWGPEAQMRASFSKIRAQLSPN